MDDRTADHASETKPFQFSGRIRSFRHAIAGVLRMIQCQHNAWIHAAATLVVLAAAFVLRISATDWCWIILAISIVWTAEALNTAFEFLADAAASPDFHPLVRDAKDVAAGAVLLTATAAVVIGSIVFWPYVERLFSSSVAIPRGNAVAILRVQWLNRDLRSLEI
ncbi:MAG: diacylglycerol kinase [Verrucomicrobia bacterium]|nr:MAG: diacylglycerol kinase [Verrucomicrobiota bacterium]